MKNTLRSLSPTTAFVGIAGLALAACTGSGDAGNATPAAGSGGGGTGGLAGSPGGAGRGGSTGAAGTTGASGTTGAAGAANAAGTSGMAGTPGAAGSGGGAGGNAAGRVGTSGGVAGRAGNGGALGAGTGGTAGMDAAGEGGTSGSGSTDVAPSAGCGKPAGLTSGRASIDVAGKMREYILLVPDGYDQDKPYRLIFGWHPWGGSAEQIESMGYFGLESASDGQAILVAPEGQDFQDNGLGWGNAGGEDIDFAHAMMDRFGDELCIDENRIFSTGFSFGAMFSFTLACTENSRQRAIAPMAGNTTTSGGCEDSTRSVAVMAFIGTEDSLLEGHRRAVEIFTERDGCSTETMAVVPGWCTGQNSMFAPCTCLEYQGCKAGYPVISCEYNAGHQFAPSSGPALWDFFSQF